MTADVQRLDSGGTVLAWVEHALPAPDLEGRLALARENGLALEVANRPETDLEAIRRAGLPIATLQAYEMHDAHPLHRAARKREEAAAHVRDTIEKAAALGVPRVITACGFGREIVEHPFEHCRDFFSALAPHARRHGVRILIEPLSPLRAAAMTEAGQIQRLLDELGSPDVFGAALDTGHMLDGAHDVDAYLRGWRHPVDELQLRGAGSAPPPADAPLGRWLSALRSPPAVVCVEHRLPIERDAFEVLIRHLRETL